jgi:hypothetical protein
LTATPHNGHPNSFAALMEILDPQRFLRGMDIEPMLLEPVMVRRLKEDLRRLGQTFPERHIEPIIIDDLPETAPELVLASKLAAYVSRAAARAAPGGNRQPSGPGRTRVDRVAAAALVLERGPPPRQRVNKHILTLLSGIGADDDAADLGDEELRSEEDGAVETATMAGAVGAGERWQAQIEAELAAVGDMRKAADACRSAPDARIERLIDWIDHEMLPGVRTRGKVWTERRLLIFTEYEDTRRWVERLLR